MTGALYPGQGDALLASMGVAGEWIQENRLFLCRERDGGCSFSDKSFSVTALNGNNFFGFKAEAIAGGMASAIAHVVFATNRSLLIRWIVMLLFAVPAAIAGCSVVMQVSELSLVPSPIWTYVL